MTIGPSKQTMGPAYGEGGGETALRGGALTKASRTLVGFGVLVGVGLGELGKPGEVGGLIPKKLAGAGAGTATTVGAGVGAGAAVIVAAGTGVGDKLGAGTGAGAGAGGAAQAFGVPLSGSLHVFVHCAD